MLIKTKIKLCLGSSCFARGNNDLIKMVQKFISKNNIQDRVEFSGSHCSNECSNGPNIRIGGRLYNQISKDNIDEILEEALSEILKS